MIYMSLKDKSGLGIIGGIGIEGVTWKMYCSKKK